jgi:hypothetical protein
MMQRFIKSLLEGKPYIPNYQDSISLVKESKKKHPKEFKAYKLWTEFLKRSDNYKSTCIWFDETHQRSPYPGCERLPSSEISDFVIFMLTFLQLYQSRPVFTLENLFNISLKNIKAKSSQVVGGEFFSWAYDAGFPFSDEMLMNYAVFGDVFNSSPVASAFRGLRISLLIELHCMSSVFEIHETIDVTFVMAETMAENELGRKPNLDEFKEWLSKFLNHENRLHITVQNPHKNKEDILNQISDLIESRRKKTRRFYKEHKKEHDFFEPDRFELPGSNLHEDELRRYLKVYDLKSSGKKMKVIAKIVHDEYKAEDIDSAKRVTYRDHKKALEIIKNVEKGFFPGKF